VLLNAAVAQREGKSSPGTLSWTLFQVTAIHSFIADEFILASSHCPGHNELATRAGPSEIGPQCLIDAQTVEVTVRGISIRATTQ
jgi:hypothetical protein